MKVAVLAVAVALLSVAPASAGTYDINACGSAGVNHAWVPDTGQPTLYDFKSTCPLQVLSHQAPGIRAPFFTGAGWRLVPPPGTVVDRLRIRRFGYAFADDPNDNSEGWTSEGWTEDGQIGSGFVAESCKRNGAGECEWGVNDANAAPADWDIDATDVRYQVVCVRGSGCVTGSQDGFPLTGVTIFSATATIRDDTAPTLTATGGPLTPGWHKPSEPITVTATDASGIASATAAAGTGTGLLATPCDYTRNPPCGNVNGQLTLTNATDGTQPLTITAKDPAGNPTSLTRAVSIDGNAPFANLQDTRRTIQIKVTDDASGVQGGQIETRNGSNEAYKALPTTLKHGRLTAKGNPRADIRVTVTDNAGNQAAGAPARFDAPAHRRVPFGRATTLRGRLTVSAGPLRAVPIEVTQTIRGQTAQPVNGTATDARGRFKLRLAAGPSRTVRLVFGGAGDALRSVRAVGIRVPARSTIHASRHAVHGAQRVTFSGTIRTAGQPIPRGGLLVVLQGRSLGHWRTFADLRTTAAGRWRASYRFHGQPGRYPVRLRIRKQQGFPFELGYSRSATVTVR